MPKIIPVIKVLILIRRPLNPRCAHVKQKSEKKRLSGICLFHGRSVKFCLISHITIHKYREFTGILANFLYLSTSCVAQNSTIFLYLVKLNRENNREFFSRHHGIIFNLTGIYQGITGNKIVNDEISNFGIFVSLLSLEF